MGRLYKLVFIILLIVSLILLAASARAQSATGPPPGTTCSILENFDANNEELESLKLKIGTKKHKYSEERIYSDENGKTTRSSVSFTDNEREIGLEILNLETCRVSVIKATKKGSALITSDGYNIRVVKRPNGIEWNGRNTHFSVILPSPAVVIRMAWPNEATRTIITRKKDKNGKIRNIRTNQKYIENIIYSPYSDDSPATSETELGIYSPAIADEGMSYLVSIVESARRLLRERGVYSRAFPQYIAGDLPFLPPQAYARLLLIEHIDLTEFYTNKDRSFERVLVILRANKGKAFTTCNSSKPWKACGGFQFTDRWRGKKPGTYSTIVRTYPKAELAKSFLAGAFDHVNAAMAAILLHDYNLANLAASFGEKITAEPLVLEELLASAYNGSPNHVHNNLKAYFSKELPAWDSAGHLRKETKGYLVKLRYLMESGIPSK